LVLSAAAAGTCGAPYGDSDRNSLRSGSQVGQLMTNSPNAQTSLDRERVNPRR
jgi:hypothetical protein